MKKQLYTIYLSYELQRGLGNLYDAIQGIKWGGIRSERFQDSYSILPCCSDLIVSVENSYVENTRPEVIVLGGGDLSELIRS